jgi:hypothetical protein
MDHFEILLCKAQQHVHPSGVRMDFVHYYYPALPLLSSIACNAAAMLKSVLLQMQQEINFVLQLSNVLLCGAQQDINIQLDNNNGRFLNTAVRSTAARIQHCKQCCQLYNVLLCHAQQDIYILLDNNTIFKYCCLFFIAL